LKQALSRQHSFRQQINAFTTHPRQSLIDQLHSIVVLSRFFLDRILEGQRIIFVL